MREGQGFFFFLNWDNTNRMYLVFTRMQGETCRRRFRSLLLCSGAVSRAPVTSLSLLIQNK